MRYVIISIISIFISKNAFEREFQSNITLNDSFSINGQISGLEKGFIYILYKKNSKETCYDSINVQNGLFIYSGNLTEPTRATFMHGKQEVSFYIDQSKMFFYAQIDSFTKASLKGSKINDDIVKRAEMIRKRERYNRDNGIKEDIRELMLYTDSIFIENNVESYYNLILLDYYFSDLNYKFIKSTFERNSLKNKESELGGVIQSKLLESEKSLPGKIIPAFTYQNEKGKKASSDLLLSEGKALLIEFWASWCVPCRKNNPFLRSIYNTYKEKGLVVLTISIDEKSPDWMNAILKDSLGIYYNGLDDNNSTIQKLFGVVSIPVTILLDNKGQVIGKYNGRSTGHAKLANTLDQYLQ